MLLFGLNILKSYPSPREGLRLFPVYASRNFCDCSSMNKSHRPVKLTGALPRRSFFWLAAVPAESPLAASIDYKLSTIAVICFVF